MSDPIPLLDLKAQDAAIGAEVRAAVGRVLDSQRFIMGPEVERFEAEVARYLGCGHALGVSSGTDALLVALMALDIGPGDEVVTTPFTFFATAGAVARLGATPVFVDVEPGSLNLDPAGIEAALTPRTRAVIAVHLFGRCADVGAIRTRLEGRDVAIIEDAAQAIGADLGGTRAGRLGDVACFSFFPSKNLGCAGDGGLVTTDDAGLARKLEVLRLHGAAPKYTHHVVGGNFRLDALQAAILSAKLPHLDDWNAARRQVAARYDALLRDRGLVGDGGPVRALPSLQVDGTQVFHQYVVRLRDRDAIQASLTGRGIGCAVYYPSPLHLQRCFADLGYGPGDLPVAERASREVLALPMYPELALDAQRRVVEAIATA